MNPMNETTGPGLPEPKPITPLRCTHTPGEWEISKHGTPAADEDAAAGLEPGTLAADRRQAKHGITVVRFSSGHVITQNRRGRCIDAPCCGCCS